MDTLIPCEVCGAYAKLSTGTAGAVGSYRAASLSVSFDKAWDGTAKSVFFYDARRENPVCISITDALKDECGHYIVPLPNEPMRHAGEITLTFRGVDPSADALVMNRVVVAASTQLRVLPAELPGQHVSLKDLTPERADQLQRQVDALAGKTQTVLTSESERVGAETARKAAENTRGVDETARKNAEVGRKDAETARAGAEDTRKAQENARVSGEEVRKTQETGRVGAEVTRASAESARKTAETDRAGKESVRQTKEAERMSAETARAGAETGRKTAEDGRATAETSRKTAEGARVRTEDARTAAELVRDAAETVRKTQETGRVGAEAARVSAESKRVNTFAAEVKQAQDARTGAQAAAAAAAGSASAAKGSETAAASAVQTHNSAAAAHSGLFEGVKTWAKGAFAALGHSHTAADVGALPTQVGATGQVLGFTAPNTVGAMDAPKGGDLDISYVHYSLKAVGLSHPPPPVNGRMLMSRSLQSDGLYHGNISATFYSEPPGNYNRIVIDTVPFLQTSTSQPGFTLHALIAYYNSGAAYTKVEDIFFKSVGGNRFFEAEIGYIFGIVTLSGSVIGIGGPNG